MTLVLFPARACDLFAAIAHEFEPPKIFEDRYRAAAEDFHALFRSRLVAISKIADRPQCAVRKLERRNDIVHAVLARIAHRLRLHFRGALAGEKTEEIYEMADLAEDASASLLDIVHPMIGRNITGIHAVVDGQRFVDLRQEFFHLHGHGRESAIEADHKERRIVLCRHSRRYGDHQCRQVLFIQAERLFAEHGLPGAQGGQRLTGMKMVRSGDEHGLDLWIL